MNPPWVVLDAAGLEDIELPTVRAVLRRTAERGGQVWCAAVTIAEVARGRHRTTHVHRVLRSRHGGMPFRVQVTDERLAFLVGALLNSAQLGSEAIADAHVVATCASVSVALVVTNDSDDIAALAVYLPGVRVITRRPDLAER